MVTKAQTQGLGPYADRGFTLDRPDDDTIDLLHDGVFVARFSQKGATEESLQAACSTHLAYYHPDRT